MVNKDRTLTAFLTYIVMFIFMSVYSYLLLLITHLDQISELNLIAFESDFDLIMFYVEFTAIQFIFFWIMSLFSRVDGFWNIPSSTSLFFSYRLFFNQNRGFVTNIILFLAIGILTTDFSFKPLGQNSFVLESFLFFLGLMLFFNALFWGIDFKNNRLKIEQRRNRIILISITTFSLGLTLLEFIESRFREYFISAVVVAYLSIIIYSLFNLLKKNLKIKYFFSGLFFREYLKADKSKKNAENLNLIFLLFEKDTAPIKALFHEILKRPELFFMRSDRGRNFFKDSSFLDLRLSREFEIFIFKLDETFRGSKYSYEVSLLNEKYFNNQQSFTEELMDVRTENIKMRNHNNLVIGLFLYSLSFLTIVMVTIDWLEMFILYVLVWSIFIRMCLRTVEIGKAFYDDLTENSHKNSFLTGTDRIVLAIKSIGEIFLLSASIYLLSYPFLVDNQGMKMCVDCFVLSFSTLWRVLEYSLSVSIFNVSFPDPLFPESTKGFVWLSTHVIQVIASLLLISISISGYMGGEKHPVYFEFIFSEENVFKIVRKSKNSPHKTKEILKYQFNGISTSMVSEKLKISDLNIIFDMLSDMHLNNTLSTKDYDHLMKLLNEDIYYFSPLK